MPVAIQAGLWGALAGSALVVGALVGWFVRLPPRWIAAVMAFGAGVLVSALSFEMMEQAWRRGGLVATSLGFLGGALAYTAAGAALARAGAKHRKRSGDRQRSEARRAGSGAAIAIGALLDGVPESIVVGLSLLDGAGPSVATVVAVFLSNLPEGLSSAAGMRAAGRSAVYVLGVWAAIAAASGIAAWAGCALMADVPTPVVGGVSAVAAGAVLAMVADTMIPEAFETAHEAAGLITVAGFLASFVLSKLVA